MSALNEGLRANEWFRDSENVLGQSARQGGFIFAPKKETVMRVTVRDAQAADASIAAAVMSAATAQLRRVYRPNQQAVARARAAKEIRWLLAMDGAAAVGALRYVIECDGLHLGLGVRPEHQRKGVAKALVDFLAAKALSMSLPKLSLYAIKETGNVPIFERLGFTVIREQSAEGIQSVTGCALTDVYMERALSPMLTDR
jgi:GNAT superfamily N-acetyltransferase